MRRLPQNLVRLCSRLSGREAVLPLGRGFTLVPLPAEVEFYAQGEAWPPAEWSAGASAQGASNEMRLALEAEGEIWRLRACGPAAEALLALPEGLCVEDIPAALRPALWFLSAEPLLDQASAALGHVLRPAVEPEEQECAPEHGAFALPFSLRDESGREAGAGRALIPLSPAALALWADMLKLFPRRRPDASAVFLQLCLCAGREDFPLALLRRAEAGDVLRLNAPSPPALVMEAGGKPLWTAVLADGKITLKALLDKNIQESVMNAESAEDAPPPGAPEGEKGGGLSAGAIDALEVSLSLEVEERRVSVAELAALAPGHTLETAASLDAPVTIKVSGRAVGKGRLVEVGDRLGVMILALDLTK
ncbi:MAG: type III secretion system cytoplasmic ring protein SctQ [Deltaproteobacteria bacterium]|jgi:type III secretion system YscQ/HrcQ family protein|nr:type III secretion system cytoplasmic ring protein SctQ [Deltaproteobacteria bacterium]